MKIGSWKGLTIYSRKLSYLRVDLDIWQKEYILFNISYFNLNQIILIIFSVFWPNNINFCVKGEDSEFLVIKLDLLGISCSSGSACATLSGTNSSYVIKALSKKDCEGSSLRFTLGRLTNKKDITLAISALNKVIAK